MPTSVRNADDPLEEAVALLRNDVSGQSANNRLTSRKIKLR
jgi:hypothetical protein